LVVKEPCYSLPHHNLDETFSWKGMHIHSSTSVNDHDPLALGNYTVLGAIVWAIASLWWL